MATGRPASMIILTTQFDETNTSQKSASKKEINTVVQNSNSGKLTTNDMLKVHSSSSSIDSAGKKTTANVVSELQPIATASSTTATSSTTNSDSESEQEEHDIEDDNAFDSDQFLRQRQQQSQPQQQQQLQSKDNRLEQKTPIEQISRRQKHFQKLFKSEISHDMPELIDSYVCAYQGDILLQGKMYMTDRYLCFHSRIISYVTKHVYRWEQIEHVSKERVAFIFPTAIGIQLKQSGKKIIYASFLQRDQAFEKILSIWSRFNGRDPSSGYDDDNSVNDGTLKATTNNGSNDKNKKYPRELGNSTFDMVDGSEQEDLIQICMDQDNDKRRQQSVSSKSSDEKRQQEQKKLFNSASNKKSTLKNTDVDQLVSNGVAEHLCDTNVNTGRYSRFNKNVQKPNETQKKSNNTGVVPRRPHSTSLKTRENRSRERSTSAMRRSPVTINRTDSPPSLSPTTTQTPGDVTLPTDQSNGLVSNISGSVLSSLTSLVKAFVEYVSELIGQLKTYPLRTSLTLFIFIALLFFHSFYLIKLAYRIENRLQSLHHMWPTSSIKTTLPS